MRHARTCQLAGSVSEAALGAVRSVAGVLLPLVERLLAAFALLLLLLGLRLLRLLRATPVRLLRLRLLVEPLLNAHNTYAFHVDSPTKTIGQH